MSENVVQIVISGNDTSGPAVDSARKRIVGLGATATAQAKNIRSSFQAIGTVAGRMGGDQIQETVMYVDALALSARAASEAFTRFGAARVAAYGVIGVAVGVAAKLITDETKKQELMATATAAATAMQDELAVSILRYSSTVELALEVEQQRYRKQQERIEALQKEGAEVEHLTRLNDALNRGTREKLQNDSAGKANNMWSDMYGKQGKLLKGSNFSDSGSRAYQYYKPEEAAEVLALQRQYDAQLALFKTYTSDKADIDEFAKANEAARSKALAVLNKKLHDEEVAQRLAKEKFYADQAAGFFENLANASKAFGKEGFKAWQAFSIAKAIIDTYTAANAAYAALAGIPFIGPVLGAAAAGAAIAAGLANVAIIASTKPPAAHGGASYIPEETTYLLNKGERVLSPRQNEDLTSFMTSGGDRGGRTITIDGRKIGEELYRMSRDGRLKIDGRAIVNS